MKDPHPPFALTYSPSVSEILFDLGCSLVISTYQAGKVIFLSATSRDKIIQLSRTFKSAMGIALNKNQLAVACQFNLILLKNFPERATNYPSNPNTYDALFIPVCSYYTGVLNLHDMNFINAKIVAVNTLFSCISIIDEEYSFKPLWNPPFINHLYPEDHCHLNGMAVHQDQIEYATALGTTNTPDGWRDNKLNGGVLIHVPSKEIVLKDLSMPHSPRIYNDKLYFLNSAQGELRLADPEKGKSEVITTLGGFARGMARYGDFLFIGMSKLRHTTRAFADLPIAKSSFAGVVIVHIPDGKIVGIIKYESSVDEIYDVKILPEFQRPGIVNFDQNESKQVITTPVSNYWSIDTNNKQK